MFNLFICLSSTYQYNRHLLVTHKFLCSHQESLMRRFLSSLHFLNSLLKLFHRYDAVYEISGVESKNLSINAHLCFLCTSFVADMESSTLVYVIFANRITKVLMEGINKAHHTNP